MYYGIILISFYQYSLAKHSIHGQTSNGIGQQSEFSVQKKEDQQIDFVLAWVDGSDPDWQRRKAQIVGDASAGDGVFCYREWGCFHTGSVVWNSLHPGFGKSILFVIRSPQRG